jgi:hypothetical protein
MMQSQQPMNLTMVTGFMRGPFVLKNPAGQAPLWRSSHLSALTQPKAETNPGNKLSGASSQPRWRVTFTGVSTAIFAGSRICRPPQN